MVSFGQVACPIATFVGQSLTVPVAAAEPESCPGLIAFRDALFSWAALRQDEVGLTFVGHATFLIETPQGVRIATDYSDGSRPSTTPDVATMNKAHSTHFSYHLDPAIKQVLRGWNPAGGPAVHDLTVQDVRTRNVLAYPFYQPSSQQPTRWSSKEQVRSTRRPHVLDPRPPAIAQTIG